MPLNWLLDNPPDNSSNIEPLIHGSMKDKLPELEHAIDGFITPEQAEKINEGAGKKKSVRISRAGCYIKPLLVQCATAVVKSEKHPEIRNRYLKLKKRRGHKKAIIAIARMLLTAIYNILKKKESYNSELYRKSDVLPVNRYDSLAKTGRTPVLRGLGFARCNPLINSGTIS